MRRVLAAAACGLAAAAYAQVPGPAPGNELNRAPVNPTTHGRARDAEGLGTREPAARSPTGRLYDMPIDPGETPEPKDGWLTAGFAELGAMGVRGDTRSAGFLNYKDVKNGPYLNLFALTGERARDARFFEATGGALGMNDAFYRILFGRYNDWKISAFYDETPHTQTASFRSLWSGVGSGNLVLAGLAPGGTTNAATTAANLRSALAVAPESSLETIRRKAGVRADVRISEGWKAYASFTDERREGARPLGTLEGNANLYVAEPIDYATRDFAAGLQFNDTVSSFNLRASASFFRNGIDTLTFDNPMFVTPTGTTGLASSRFTQGRFDLPPDNQRYDLKGEYARALPFWRGNLTATAAIGTSRQDDALVAPTPLDLAGGTVNPGGTPLAAGSWSTVDALSRRSADLRLDTRLVDLGLTLRPLAALDLRGKVRYYDARNGSQYLACNPLTGQWGRLILDGTATSFGVPNAGARVNPAGTPANAFDAAACNLDAARALNLVPAAGNVPIATAPYDQRQMNASVTADYRVGRASSVYATVEREEIDRDFRERKETREDRVKLGYVNRGLVEGTVRLGYEHAQRGGSEYVANPYAAFRSAALGPLPASGNPNVASWLNMPEQFRRFDLADRHQDLFSARIDHAVLDGLDAAATLRLKDAAFPSQYGLAGRQRTGSATFDVTWHVSHAGTMYGFYAYEAGEANQKGVQQDNSCLLGNTYYFYSDGRSIAAVTGAAAPATPAGTTLVGTTQVTPSNFIDVCGIASPSSPLLNTSREWDVQSKNRNQTLGVGLNWDFGRARLDTNFMRALGRSRIRYSTPGPAFGLNAQQLALAGGGLPDIDFTQNIFDVSVIAPLRPNVSMRVLFRYESGRIRDWHYEGLAENAQTTATSMYLDSGPRDYRATLIGIFFLVRL